MTNIEDIEFRCYRCNNLQKTKTKIGRFSCNYCGCKVYVAKALRLMATKSDDWYNEQAEKYWAKENIKIAEAKKMYEESKKDEG